MITILFFITLSFSVGLNFIIQHLKAHVIPYPHQPLTIFFYLRVISKSINMAFQPKFLTERKFLRWYTFKHLIQAHFLALILENLIHIKFKFFNRASM